MKKIYKLILKSYLGPLVVTFFIVQFVLMMNFVWRYIDELTGKGLDVSTIAELLACATANMIPLGLPLSMLLSAIMAMGNLGENFELRGRETLFQQECGSKADHTRSSGPIGHLVQHIPNRQGSFQSRTSVMHVPEDIPSPTVCEGNP